MKKKLFIFIFILIIFVLSSCSKNTEEIKKLSDNEITEYQGENLSSILDFRENSIKGPQNVDIESYFLIVDGLVKTPAKYTYSQVLENIPYTKKITLHCVEGWSVDILWEGVKLEDIISKSEILPSANTVIFYSTDGYTTSLFLHIIIDKELLLAYKMNGLILPPERGFPFQVVAEDKLGYKWAKWVEKIELSDNADYEGFWESRGYNNEADVKNK